MTPAQCRAARAFLEWTQPQLAAAAGISPSTLRDFEAGRRTPISNNLAAIEATFTKAGIEFEGETTVKMNFPPYPHEVYEYRERFKAVGFVLGGSSKRSSDVDSDDGSK